MIQPNKYADSLNELAKNYSAFTEFSNGDLNPPRLRLVQDIAKNNETIFSMWSFYRRLRLVAHKGPRATEEYHSGYHVSEHELSAGFVRWSTEWSKENEVSNSNSTVAMDAQFLSAYFLAECEFTRALSDAGAKDVWAKLGLRAL